MALHMLVLLAVLTARASARMRESGKDRLAGPKVSSSVPLSLSSIGLAASDKGGECLESQAARWLALADKLAKQGEGARQGLVHGLLHLVGHKSGKGIDTGGAAPPGSVSLQQEDKLPAASLSAAPAMASRYDRIMTRVHRIRTSVNDKLADTLKAMTLAYFCFCVLLSSVITWSYYHMAFVEAALEQEEVAATSQHGEALKLLDVVLDTFNALPGAHLYHQIADELKAFSAWLDVFAEFRGTDRQLWLGGFRDSLVLWFQLFAQACLREDLQSTIKTCVDVQKAKTFQSAALAARSLASKALLRGSFDGPVEPSSFMGHKKWQWLYFGPPEEGETAWGPSTSMHPAFQVPVTSIGFGFFQVRLLSMSQGLIVVLLSTGLGLAPVLLACQQYAMFAMCVIAWYLALHPVTYTNTIMEAYRLQASIKNVEDATAEIGDWTQVLSSQTPEKMEQLMRLWQLQTLPRLNMLKAVRGIISETSQDRRDERLRLIENTTKALHEFNDSMGPDWAWMQRDKLKDGWVADVRRQMLLITRDLSEQPNLASLAKLPALLYKVHVSVAIRAVSLRSDRAGQEMEYAVTAQLEGQEDEGVDIVPLSSDPSAQLSGRMPYEEFKCTPDVQHVCFVATAKNTSWMGDAAPSWSMKTSNIQLNPGVWHTMEETRMHRRPSQHHSSPAAAPKVVLEFHYASCVKHLVSRDNPQIALGGDSLSARISLAHIGHQGSDPHNEDRLTRSRFASTSASANVYSANTGYSDGSTGTFTGAGAFVGGSLTRKPIRLSPPKAG